MNLSANATANTATAMAPNMSAGVCKPKKRREQETRIAQMMAGQNERRPIRLMASANATAAWIEGIEKSDGQEMREGRPNWQGRGTARICLKRMASAKAARRATAKWICFWRPARMVKR